MLTKLSSLIQVSFCESLPPLNDTVKTLFVLTLKEEIIIYEARQSVCTELDKISGTKVTSLAVDRGLLAAGWAPFGFGIGSEFEAKV